MMVLLVQQGNLDSGAGETLGRFEPGKPPPMITTFGMPVIGDPR
jgi:hypothetical protein